MDVNYINDIVEERMEKLNKEYNDLQEQRNKISSDLKHIDERLVFLRGSYDALQTMSYYLKPQKEDETLE